MSQSIAIPKDVWSIVAFLSGYSPDAKVIVDARKRCGGFHRSGLRYRTESDQGLLVVWGGGLRTLLARGEGEEEKERKKERSWGALVPATPRR